MALSGHAQGADECPLSGVKRTLTNRYLPNSIYECRPQRRIQTSAYPFVIVPVACCDFVVVIRSSISRRHLDTGEHAIERIPIKALVTSDGERINGSSHPCEFKNSRRRYSVPARGKSLAWPRGRR